jgi:hypothetical protein
VGAGAAYRGRVEPLEGTPRTESEWLRCEDTITMLNSLKGAAGERKLRLLNCACCRRIWPLIPDERSRKAVESSEDYADGLIGRFKLHCDGISASDAARGTPKNRALPPYSARITAQNGNAEGGAVARAAQVIFQGAMMESRDEPYCSLLREIFRPFRRMSINPAWLDPTVSSLAQAAYEERILPSGELDPPRLAVLSDALEEAGCDDADLLEHLRSPGPHVRGCWAVDLVLGKE